jgi:molybdate transport system substrate-binding protein
MLFILLWLAPAGLLGADAVAVAGSLFPCVEELAARYQASGRPAPQLVLGSSGKLALQIEAGAPYGLFLSADLEWLQYLRDRNLCGEVLPLAESPLVMWWPRAEPPEPVLLSGSLRVAIADPEAAPFGRIARQYLEDRNLYARLVQAKRLIITDTVLQSVLATQSGGADIAFTSLSVTHKLEGGNYAVLPYSLQHAGSLISGRATEGLRAFWAFLRSEEAISRWEAWGFVPAPVRAQGVEAAP